MLIWLIGTSVSLDLSVMRDGLGALSGLNPTVALRKAETTEEYLDFADGLFKTSGWVEQFATMIEVSSGRYRQAIDLSVVDVSEGLLLVAEYAFGSGTSSGIAQEHVRIESAGLTQQQNTWLKEVFLLHGLDPTKPLLVNTPPEGTDGSGVRRVPQSGAEINQITEVSGTTTIITRVL